MSMDMQKMFDRLIRLSPPNFSSAPKEDAYDSLLAVRRGCITSV